MRQQMIGIGVAALLVAGPVASAVIQDAKATEILAASRKAIGDKKLEGMKSLSVQASIQRNVSNMQMQTESEMLLEMPDKYVKTDSSSGMMNLNFSTGFNGEKAILPAGATAAPGGGMVIRMGGGGAAAMDPHGGEKPTPEQMAEMNKASVRNSRQEISRLMLGWFAQTHPTLKSQYTYAGEAESPDGKAYVIDVKDEDGFAARLFIDQNSKLPLMVTYKGRAPRVVTNRMGGPQVTTTQGRTQPLTEEEARKLKADTEKKLNELKTEAAQAPMVDFSLFFEDWREVEGVNFPHTIRRASEGTTSEEWKINRVKVNPRIDAKKFTVVGTN